LLCCATTILLFISIAPLIFGTSRIMTLKPQGFTCTCSTRRIRECRVGGSSPVKVGGTSMKTPSIKPGTRKSSLIPSTLVSAMSGQNGAPSGGLPPDVQAVINISLGAVVCLYLPVSWEYI
jgi:hypothetical protein